VIAGVAIVTVVFGFVTRMMNFNTRERITTKIVKIIKEMQW
jgi:hypothetical protein